jgi:hypothetical protein
VQQKDRLGIGDGGRVKEGGERDEVQERVKRIWCCPSAARETRQGPRNAVLGTEKVQRERCASAKQQQDQQQDQQQPVQQYCKCARARAAVRPTPGAC